MFFEKVIISCLDREITPGGANGTFPTWIEIIHALARVSRFCGRQDPNLDWNVLKHSLAVAILSGKFIPGILHDWSEMFTNDTPTPFKTDEQRAFEKACYIKMGHHLADLWPGFSADKFINARYKPADSIMLDIESRRVINCTDDHYEKYFRYDEEKYKVKFDKDRVYRLYEHLLDIPTKFIERALTALMNQLTEKFSNDGYDHELVLATTHNFLDIFDMEKAVAFKISPPTKHKLVKYKHEILAPGVEVWHFPYEGPSSEKKS